MCALEQEKDGPVYKLQGQAEIHYSGYILRADEVTYNSETGEVVAEGHVVADGGSNDEHLVASRATYNMKMQTGKFENVAGAVGVQLKQSKFVLTSSSPFAFTGKSVEKTGPDHYVVNGGTVTTCNLPKPKWEFSARKVVVDVGADARIYQSTFRVEGIPVLYLPFATHPVDAPGSLASSFQVSATHHARERFSASRSTGRLIAAWTQPWGRNTFRCAGGRRRESFAQGPPKTHSSI